MWQELGRASYLKRDKPASAVDSNPAPFKESWLTQHRAEFIDDAVDPAFVEPHPAIIPPRKAIARVHSSAQLISRDHLPVRGHESLELALAVVDQVEIA